MKTTLKTKEVKLELKGWMRPIIIEMPPPPPLKSDSISKLFLAKKKKLEIFF